MFGALGPTIPTGGGGRIMPAGVVGPPAMAEPGPGRNDDDGVAFTDECWGVGWGC